MVRVPARGVVAGCAQPHHIAMRVFYHFIRAALILKPCSPLAKYHCIHRLCCEAAVAWGWLSNTTCNDRDMLSER